MIGKKIISFRNQKGWSQKDLADILEMDPAHLGKIENGHHKPTSKTLRHIAEKLGLQVEYFTSTDPESVDEFDEVHFNKMVKRIATLSQKKKKALGIVLGVFFDNDDAEKLFNK